LPELHHSIKFVTAYDDGTDFHGETIIYSRKS
jgi:hypothetical protein